MSASLQPTAAPAAGAAIAARKPGDGFFRHHGVWAAGVRLFRTLQFRSKALIISAAFLLPLLLVSAALWQTKQELIDAASKERAGTAAMRPLASFYAELTNVRNAARATLGGHDAKADYAAAYGAASRALDQLVRDTAEGGDPLAIRPAVDKLQAAWRATATAQDGADANGRTVFGPVTASARELLNAIGDNSGLVLDPDIDSFYLIDAMVLVMPKAIEDAGQLWGWGTFAAAKGALEPKQLREFDVWLARADAEQQELRDYLGRAIKATPALQASVDLKPFDTLKTFIADVGASVFAGKANDAALVYTSGKTALQGLQALYVSTLPVIDALLVARIDAAQRERAVLSAVVLVFVLVGVYLFCAFFLVTQGGLREVQKHLEAMTAGDLTGSPSPWGKDEAAALMLSLRDMQTALRRIVGNVRASSEAIVHASTDIASASVDLSARTEQTAANLEQSASSMEQISATIRQTADHVGEAASLAANNSSAAARGGTVVDEVVSTMQQINQSSSKIGDIIGVIDGIAFQTNILALNAAVEAARAGEQGKGFAVVAGEVRSLAKRSAQAAKEISGLIGASVGRVAAGTTAVQGAGETMTELVLNARRMNDLLAEVSTASTAQSRGVGQIGVAVQTLDRMTQQNAALVEQTKAAATALKGQALGLAAEVAAFRLPLAAAGAEQRPLSLQDGRGRRAPASAGREQRASTVPA